MTIPAAWVEELVLQTYLFAGFPRALNAMREWRRVQPDHLPDDAAGGPVDLASGRHRHLRGGVRRHVRSVA